MIILRKVWEREELLSKSEHEERLRKMKKEITPINEYLQKLHNAKKQK